MIESPLPGEPVSNKVHQAPIKGNAVAEGDRPADFDVVLVIDVSGSTKVASGVDVDGDGEVGIDPHFELLPPGTYSPDIRNTDPQDSILAAEIAAAEALLATLDSDRVRVGVISFSGEMNPNTGSRVRFDYGPGRFGNEAPFARRVGASEEDDGYVVTIVSDANTHRSECWVFSARDIEKGPIAKLALPSRVPSGFHAKWIPGEKIWHG